MGGHQLKDCTNCRSWLVGTKKVPCNTCDWDGAIYQNWKSRRGRKAGSKSKPGTEKPGPKTKPSGELMCFPVLSIKAKDLEAYGGPDKLKADVKQMVDKEINK